MLFAEEEFPPDFPFLHGRWERDGGAEFDGRRAGHAYGDNGQVAVLDVVSVGASPFLDGGGRVGVRDGGLQGELGLHSLCCLCAHKFSLLVEQVEFLQAAVELQHDKDKDDDADCHKHAAHVDGDGCHASILPLSRKSVNFLTDVTHRPEGLTCKLDLTYESLRDVLRRKLVNFLSCNGASTDTQGLPDEAALCNRYRTLLQADIITASLQVTVTCQVTVTFRRIKCPR